MLLAIDIGNTATTLGVFDGEKLRVMWNIASVIQRLPDEYAMTLFDLLQRHGLDKSDIKEVSLCATVPPLVGVWVELLDRYFNITPLVIGAGIKTGVRLRMDFPGEVGPDRIVNAAAARHLYGGTLIIVDMGTATTFDAVSKDGDYLGGAIAPGVATAAEALSTRTARLPRIELSRPKKAIGTNTVTAMQSGLIFGYVGLVEGIVARIQQEMGEKARVVAAGGYARLIAGETKVFDVVNPELTLYGLQFIHQMNKV